MQDVARDRAAWDVAHPQDAKRRLHALQRYERYDARIEARHLPNKWKEDPAWTGAKRQTEFEVWHEQLERAIQHVKTRTKHEKEEAKVRTKRAQSQRQDSIDAQRTCATTIDKHATWCAENDIEREQARLQALAQTHHVTAPDLYATDDPATAIACFQNRLDFAKAELKRLQDKAAYHKRARDEAVPYRQRNGATFWKNSKNTLIMAHRHAKVIALCAPNQCKECLNAEAELARLRSI